MRKKNYKGRCEKKSVQKCNEIFKAYDAVQSAYVNVLSSRDDIIEIRCNVTLEDMEYTSDFCVFETYIPCTDTELFEAIGNVPDIESLESEQIRVMHERYTIIAGVLPYIGNVKIRSCGIDEVARTNHISKQTVRNYLCKYLTYMDILALAPKKKDADRELSSFEKNIRWGLNMLNLVSTSLTRANHVNSELLAEAILCVDLHQDNSSRQIYVAVAT